MKPILFASFLFSFISLAQENMKPNNTRPVRQIGIHQELGWVDVGYNYSSILGYATSVSMKWNKKKVEFFEFRPRYSRFYARSESIYPANFNPETDTFYHIFKTSQTIDFPMTFGFSLPVAKKWNLTGSFHLTVGYHLIETKVNKYYLIKTKEFLYTDNRQKQAQSEMLFGLGISTGMEYFLSDRSSIHLQFVANT
jgi:hypothetical protein